MTGTDVSPPTPDRPRAAVTPEGTVYLAMLTLALMALVLLNLPRAVEPGDVPGLRLPREAVEAQLARDRRLAEALPRSESAHTFDALMRVRLQASATGGTLYETAENQKLGRSAALQTMLRESGKEALDAFRARAAEQAISAITGQVPPDEMRARVGRLIDHMFQYDMARDAHILAPSFVIRTAAKLRYNLAADRSPIEGFSPIELQAHFGWLALHAKSLSLPERIVALEKYERAGGPRSMEARAALYYAGGKANDAAKLWTGLYERTGNLRFRNMARAGTARAAAGGGAP